MVPAIKPKPRRALKKKEQVVVLPSPNSGWEAWIMQKSAERWNTFSSPKQNPAAAQSTFAWPIKEVLCLPLWLNTTEKAQLAPALELQLEMRGLLTGGATFAWNWVAEVGSRSLILVGILSSPSAQETTELSRYAHFNVSARYYSFPENHITLWRQHETLCAAFTRGKSLVCFQALTDTEINERASQDLHGLLVSLQWEGVLEKVTGITLWFDAKEAELARLQATFSLPIHRQTQPSPVPPTTSWSLIPPQVSAARRQKKIQRWQRYGMVGFFLAYLVLAVYFSSHYLVTRHQWQMEQAWLSEHEADLNTVHKTQAAWKELEPLVDLKKYPLERLLHCAELIPPEQMHLTLFDQGSDKMKLTAEAKNAAIAFQFSESLKKSPDFKTITWTVTPPQVLPNDLAKIQIEGTDAPAQF